MDAMLGADFWIGLFKIVWINIILSGDNAVVIALAARGLPPQQQKKAVLLGSGAAVVLRIALTVVAAKLMQLPFVEVIGGLLLLWIGVGLLKGEDEEEDSGSVARQGMMAAVRTILLADLVMSLDNVIAVAAAAGGDMLLLILGLAISIPLVIFGSTLMIKLMERFPVIVTLGAALIGWVAGETITSDHMLEGFVRINPWAHYAAAACGAVLVIAMGKWMQLKAAAQGGTA
ncbi:MULTISPECIES: TerC family protein [Comamonas]|jgi:YjbE family integral membrane protein|uniref:TerC family protein n=1 Tax=Comamonas thiooxydans TaxID=363952 RepID=A0A7M1L437_9BURK|nr:MULTISPECIES: TerC family protein [Comamonas]EFI61070.1 Integral membrane protein TerC [Comamonas thiooxydans]KKI15711.1 integral membrane protein [Comamonas thiooxydans]MDH1252266.1 TerC family protein [Comamonas thiooxydans]MDH1332885.1 TerC family protein [Comamonas thiooxydans]MDH1475089.1 TerC family protein [Comamonas thiooxydans]